MKAFCLSRNIYCLTDDDIYDWLHHWKWSIANHGRKGFRYARRFGINPLLHKQQFIYLHKVVAGISKNYLLKFRDHNPLNLQRANLSVINPRGEPVKWWASNGVSRFTGVKWDGYYGLWKAHLLDLPIGYFASEMDAAEAYNKKIREFSKENLLLNDLNLEVLNAA